MYASSIRQVKRPDYIYIVSDLDKFDRCKLIFGRCKVQRGTSGMMVSWTLLLGMLLFSGKDWILIPKVGIADSFLAKIS